VLLPRRAGRVVNEHFVQSSADPAARLYVRERLPDDSTPGELDEAVLFVHGSTYPGDTFDLELAGYDWMTQVARSGAAAYYVDVRGYGRSTRPPAMSQPPRRTRRFRGRRTRPKTSVTPSTSSSTGPGPNG
jgi:pimeloyl-ACP methyl ester carboxylesterase